MERTRVGWAVGALACTIFGLVAGCMSEDPFAKNFRGVESKANVYVEPSAAAVEKVAVMPFKAETELIGSSVADTFVTEVMRMGRYQLVERGQMSKVLSESELALAGLSAARAAEVGKMLGADAVIIGTVDEYTSIASGGRTYPSVGVSARLIDCASGKVLWSVDLARRSDKRESTLAGHARAVVHEIAAGLYKELSVLQRPRGHGGARNAGAASGSRMPAGGSTSAGVGTGGTAAGQGTSADVPVVPVALPPPPTPAMSLVDMGLREVTVKWEKPADNVKKVRIERSSSSTGSFDVVATAVASDGRYVDRGDKGTPLKDGTTYYYRIKALGERDVPGALSPVKESMTALPPDPPQTVRAGALQPRAATIAWTPSPSEGVVRYVIERAAPEAPAQFAKCGEATTNWFVDGGGSASPLKDSASYLYRVYSINRVDARGTPCTPVSVKMLPPPPAVQKVAAASGQFRKVTLTWEPSADTNVVAYDVYRTAAPSAPLAKVGSAPGRSSARFVDAGTAEAPRPDAAKAFYAIRAVNSVGSESPPSALVESLTKCPPEAPTDLTTTTNRPGKIELTWGAPMEPDIRLFRVDGADARQGQYAELPRGGDSNKCSHVEAGLAAGRPRVYRVRSIDADGLMSAWSTPATGCAKPLPPAPPSLKADYFSGGVSLAWPEITCATKYRVYRKDGSDWELLGQTVSNGFAVGFQKLEDNTILGVATVETDGLESAQKAAATVMDPPPPIPAGVSAASDGLREVPLKWTAPKDNARTYRVERAAAAEGPFKKVADCDPDDAAFVDRGGEKPSLEDETDYYYRVIALNRGGRASDPSAVIPARTAPPPVPPASVKAEAPGSRALSASWEASKAAGVIAYIVERARKEQPDIFKVVGVVSSTSFREGGTPSTDLGDSLTYLYRVTSSNRVGSAGAPSTPVEVTTMPRPAVVQGLTAKSLEVRCVPLTWQESLEKDVVRYDIFRADAKDGDFVKIASVDGRTNTRHLDGGADPGKLEDSRAYFYRIRAINAVTSQSEDSDVASATTRDPPPVVKGVAAKSAVPREVPVAWTASGDEKVTGYIIQRNSEGSTNGFVDIATVKGRETASYNDRGGARRADGLGSLADGSKHEYRVLAFNTAFAKSDLSEAVTARTKPAPATPVELETTTNLPKSVRLTWKANPETDIAVYVVESKTERDGRFRELAKVPATAEARLSWVDAEEPDGAPRWYRIKAVDRDTLESEWSEISAGATKSLPDAPTALKAAWDGTDLTLTWTPPAQPDVANYKVWEKGFFGSKLRATEPEPRCRMPGQERGSSMTLLVSAVDKDGLESKRSVELEVVCPSASPAAR